MPADCRIKDNVVESNPVVRDDFARRFQAFDEPFEVSLAEELVLVAVNVIRAGESDARAQPVCREVFILVLQLPCFDVPD